MEFIGDPIQEEALILFTLYDLYRSYTAHAQ